MIDAVESHPMNPNHETDAGALEVRLGSVPSDRVLAIQGRRAMLRLVIKHLEVARDQAAYTETPRLLKAIRRTLKSADGARRNLDNRLSRALL